MMAMSDASMDDTLESIIFSSLSSDELSRIIIDGALDACKEPCIRSNPGLISLHSMSPVQFHQMFRFEQKDLFRLRTALRVPDVVKNAQGISVSGEEALCMALRRLSYPNRLCDMQRDFARSESTISLFSNGMLSHIVDTWGALLENFEYNKWLNRSAMEEFSLAVRQRGTPISNCWDFIDGTARPICRPTEDQRKYYSGHKRQHMHKYQVIMYPNGIIVHLHGPYEGSKHDAGKDMPLVA